MQTTFINKDLTTPEEYLSKMIACVGENGELNVARDVDDVSFCTADSVENATHVERVILDAKLVDYDILHDFYCRLLSGLKDGSAFKELPSENSDKYADRVILGLKRLAKLIDLGAPEVVLQCEKCILIDSVFLYKTNAVGYLDEVKK